MARAAACPASPKRQAGATIALDSSRSIAGWQIGVEVAEGALLELSDAARRESIAAPALVESIVAKGVRAYGVNTGVGALCDVVVPESKQQQLSRNIVMSHAAGVGPRSMRRGARRHCRRSQQFCARLLRVRPWWWSDCCAARA
jgi:histidine ammonia-lyase